MQSRGSDHTADGGRRSFPATGCAAGRYHGRMCVDLVIFRSDGRTLRASDQGTLARLLDVAFLPMCEGPSPIPPARHTCLCPVDIEALGRDLGMVAEVPSYAADTDHFDAWALREPPPAPEDTSAQMELSLT